MTNVFERGQFLDLPVRNVIVKRSNDAVRSENSNTQWRLQADCLLAR